MKYIIIIAVLTTLWMIYEIWRAPLMEETEDGRMITKRPTKKLTDLLRKQK